MSLDRTTMLEIQVALDALALGRSTVDLDRREIPLEGMNTMNDTVVWPKKTIQQALAGSLLLRFRAPQVLRELLAMGLVSGPLKTSRMVEGKKTNMEFWTVNERAWTDYMNEHDL